MQKVPFKRFQNKFPPGPCGQMNSQYAPDDFVDSQYRQPSELNTFQSEFSDIYTKIEEINTKCTQQIIQNLSEKQTKDFSSLIQNLGSKKDEIEKTQEKFSDYLDLNLKNLIEKIENLKKTEQDSFTSILLKFSKASDTLSFLKAENQGKRKVSRGACKKLIKKK